MDECSDSTCETLGNAIIFSNGVSTSTTWDLYNEAEPYGKSNFSLDTDLMGELYGTSTKITKFYAVTPYYQCALGACRQGNPAIFVISWHPIGDWIDSINYGNISTSTEGILNSNPHDLACSEEQWDGDYIEKAMCSLKQGFWYTVMLVPNLAKKAVDLFIIGLGQVFPFNLAVNVSRAWELSNGQALPADLSGLDIKDGNGNVKVNIPTSWSASSSITLWGTDVWEANQNLTNFFAFIRVLSKYLLWTLFIGGVLNFGQKVYKEIS